MKVNSTNDKKRMVLKGHSVLTDDEEINKRLEELKYLKVSPREEEVNKQLLFRAERLYEELLGDDRIAIERHINVFEDALDSKDKMLIERKREEFKEYMNMVENENNIFIYC